MKFKTESCQVIYCLAQKILQLDRTNILSTVFRITVGQENVQIRTQFPCTLKWSLIKVYNYFHDKYWHLELFFLTYNFVICIIISLATEFSTSECISH